MSKNLSSELFKMSGSELAKNINYDDVRRATNEDLADLKKLIVKMDSVANKRMKRLLESGEDTDRKTPFSVKGIKDINDAKRALRDVKNYLNNMENSIEGRREMRKNSTEKIGDMYGWKSKDKAWLRNKSNYDRFWRAFEELRKREGYDVNYKYSVLYNLYYEAKDKNNGYMSPSELADKMENQLETIYKAEQDAQKEAEEKVYTELI